MLARITDNHWILLDQVTQGSEDALVHYFSVRSPDAFYIDSASGWDGWYRKYDVKRQRLALPLLNELKKCCEKADIPLEIVDSRGAPKYPAPQAEQLTETFLDGITAEHYQIGAWHVCCTEEIGLISATTGSGKTETMAGLIKMFRCPTCVITESLVVLNQIAERLSLRNVVHNNDIGMFCSGHMPDNNLVIVGSIQSVSSPTEPKLHDIHIRPYQAAKLLLPLLAKQDDSCYKILPRNLVDALFENPDGLENLVNSKFINIAVEFFQREKFTRLLRAYKTRLAHAKAIQAEVSKCDLMIIDEADLATTNQYRYLLRRIFHGRRRYGLSGTPFDPTKPVRNLDLKENLGSIIHETDRNAVQERGRIIPVKSIFFPVGMSGDKHDGRAYDIAMKEEIIENETFHQLIAKINSNFVHEGNLILLDTTPIEPLGLKLESIIPNSKFLYNKSSNSERARYVKLFEARQLQCLISGKIFKRGLDLKGGVENLIIVGGGRQWSNINQMIGRAVRINSRGWARVFSFFFFNNTYLYDHSKENLKAVVSLGYPTMVYLNGKQIDGQQFIRSRFRIPK